MKFVSVILLSFAVMAVMSTAMPADSKSSSSSEEEEEARNHEDQNPEDQCNPTLWSTVESLCDHVGKNETVCFQCVSGKCYSLYQQNPSACDTIRCQLHQHFMSSFCTGRFMMILLANST
jgi:hypothetical protein